MKKEKVFSLGGGGKKKSETRKTPGTRGPSRHSVFSAGPKVDMEAPVRGNLHADCLWIQHEAETVGHP